MEGFYPFTFVIQSKKNGHEYQNPIREPTDDDFLQILCSWLAAFLMARTVRRTFTLSVFIRMYRRCRQIQRKGGCKLSRDSCGNAGKSL